MSLTDRKLLHVENDAFAAGSLLPPASTMKPFAVMALMEAGKLRPDDEYVCSGRLRIGSHSLNCVHPVSTLPMNPARAIAYSCNGAVAHFASRFTVDEFPQALLRYGFASQSGLSQLPEATGFVRHETAGASCQLQALGEEGVLITPLELLLAYARLSQRVLSPKYASVLEGLEGAVKYGTAQGAQVAGTSVAGKTGSIVLRSGSPAAWFAGFAPSRAPTLAVVVVAAGFSGGIDAAPVGGDLLGRYLKAK